MAATTATLLGPYRTEWLAVFRRRIDRAPRATRRLNRSVLSSKVGITT